LKDGLIDDTDLVFITLGIHQKEIKTEFHRNEIVLSKTAYPAASIVFFDKYNISQDIIGISLKNSWKTKLLAPYIVAFLNSKYGLSEMQQWFQGNIQMHFALPDVKRIIIPILSQGIQENVSGLYLKAYEEIRNSKNLYAQAENLLLEELGLKDFTPKYELSYTAKLSKAFEVHRVDAEYFQPTYDEVERHLVNNFGAKPIGKINFIDITTGQYSEKYVEKSEGMPYIRGTDIENGTIETNNLVYIASEDQIESKKAKEGDIVVTRVGTVGLSARIPKEGEGGTVSDNLIRLRFDQEKLNSYYLALFLGSLIGLSLMVRNSRGSVQQRLNQETLKEIVVPILPDEKQQKIAFLVQQSHEARKKAKELLEEAKRKVEGEIEK
jgi:restriction endonuclease S subunit